MIWYSNGINSYQGRHFLSFLVSIGPRELKTSVLVLVGTCWYLLACVGMSWYLLAPVVLINDETL